LRGKCVSSANLLKIVECCPCVESLVFYSPYPSDLKRSDIEALPSLPFLNSLEIRGNASIDMLYSLSLLKGLKHLGVNWSDELDEALPMIGGHLVSLAVRESKAEAWMAIYASCPKLQYLKFEVRDIAVNILATLIGGLRKRLKKLASLKVSGKSFRLGTDWAGYVEEVPSPQRWHP
jgi:hypothetical protein